MTLTLPCVYCGIVSELPIDVQNPLTDAEQGTTKKCIICEEVKPISEFHKDRDRYHPTCKICKRYAAKVTQKIRKTAPPKPDACECCGRTAEDPQRGDLVLDHDHDTDTFRGWICERCNIGIGKLGDTIEGLKNAIRYLERSNKYDEELDLFID